MANPPQSLMIFREELQKAKLEKERLKKEYEAKIAELHEDMGFWKERISSQEEMIKMAIDHAARLEAKLIVSRSVWPLMRSETVRGIIKIMFRDIFHSRVGSR